MTAVRRWIGKRKNDRCNEIEENNYEQFCLCKFDSLPISKKFDELQLGYSRKLMVILIRLLL